MKCWILLQFGSAPLGPIIGKKFTVSCVFGLNKVKLQYHMFSSMKIEEYMESDLSGIFQVKLVAKNITELSLQRDISFWRNIQMFWTRPLDLSDFLVKWYTSLIYVKKIHFV